MVKIKILTEWIAQHNGIPNWFGICITEVGPIIFENLNWVSVPPIGRPY